MYVVSSVVYNWISLRLDELSVQVHVETVT